MSGIAGYWGYAADDIPAAVFAGFVDSLSHRGPDGSGINHFPDVRLWLGHRRRAPLGSGATDRQPFADAQRRYWLTFDGAIYNEHALRQRLRAVGYSAASGSTGEIVLAAYAQWGPDCLQCFEGVWAVAILDTRQRRLFLARDRFGVKPLYYIKYAGAMAFASDPKAFSQLPWQDGSYSAEGGDGAFHNLMDQRAKLRTPPPRLRDLRGGEAVVIDATGTIRNFASEKSGRTRTFLHGSAKPFQSDAQETEGTT